MRSTINVVIGFLMVMPILLVSYQLGTPKNLTTATVSNYLNQPALKLPLSEAQAKKPVLPQRKIEMADLYLNSATALAWDYKNNFFYFSKNIDTPRPIASLTKLVSAAVVMDTVSLSDNVTVSKEAIQNEGSQGDLHEGEILTVHDLLAAALIESSNDAAYALAEYVGGKLPTHPESPTTPVRAFVRAMNQKFNDLGLVQTNFTDPTGLEDKKSFSTAHDLANFIKYLRQNSNYQEIWNLMELKTYSAKSLNGIANHEFKTTNPFFGEFNNIIGGKTGFTNTALGNMMLVLKNDNDLETIYLVLGSEDRFGDTKKLADWTASAWQWPVETKK